MPRSPVSDGDFYDTCPADGCGTFEAAHRNEGRGTHDIHTGAHEWSIYSADRRKGGCGHAWTRTNSTGAERLHAQGKAPVGLTRAAETERSYFTPSDAYRDQYERIFGHA